MSLPSQFKEKNSEHILIYHYVEEMVADFSAYSDENYSDEDISLQELFGVLGYQGEEIDKAITIYREYYNGMGGCFENEVYPGIEDTLAKLKAAGKKLIVCTSKNAHGTKTVLEHFGLDKYFDFVATANDTDRQHKIDVLRYALEQGGVADLKRAVMVGDRMYDIEASAEVGVDSIGVLYGYGSKEELTNAGATYLAETAEDIVALIL